MHPCIHYPPVLSRSPHPSNSTAQFLKLSIHFKTPLWTLPSQRLLNGPSLPINLIHLDLVPEPVPLLHRSHPLLVMRCPPRQMLLFHTCPLQIHLTALVSSQLPAQMLSDCSLAPQ